MQSSVFVVCLLLHLNQTPDSLEPYHTCLQLSLLLPPPYPCFFLDMAFSNQRPPLLHSCTSAPALSFSPYFSHPLSLSTSPLSPPYLTSVYVCVCLPSSLFPPCLPAVLQVRLLYCSQEEAELVFKAAWAAGQAGASHMWFAVGPALSGLGTESLPRALFAVRPQGWRDEPRRRIARGVSVLTHGAVATRKDYGTTGGPNFVTNCMTDANQTQRLRGRMR